MLNNNKHNNKGYTKKLHRRRNIIITILGRSVVKNMNRLMIKPTNDCAPSNDSDQPGHPPSLIRVFACAQWVAKDSSFLHVFAGRTCQFLVLSWGGSIIWGIKKVLQSQTSLWYCSEGDVILVTSTFSEWTKKGKGCNAIDELYTCI